MVFGKRIQLFLVDGTPNGRWICELSNWTGIAYKLPRNMIKESEKRSNLPLLVYISCSVMMTQKIGL